MYAKAGSTPAAYSCIILRNGNAKVTVIFVASPLNFIHITEFWAFPSQ